MSTIVLKTQPRAGAGSRQSRKERAKGRVPVNLYGHGEGNAALTVDEHELSQALGTSTQIFTLASEAAEQACLVKEVQYDTFGQQILHVDFARVDLSEQVDVVVTLEFRGNPAGVAEGGTQVVHHPSLAVRCRADSIPEILTVDVSALEIGHSVQAGEVELPDGVVLDEGNMSPTEPIVAVAAPRVAEEEKPEEEEEGEVPVEGEEAPTDEAAEGSKDGGDKPSDGGEG